MHTTEASWLLPYIWTQEWGFNWDMVINYFFVTAVAAFPVITTVHGLTSFCKAQVNKIKFTIPFINFIVDFNAYVWDDKLFDDLGAALENKALARQTDARKIKVQFKMQLQAAGSDPEAQAKVFEDTQAALEGLSDTLVEEMKADGDQLLWSALETRFGGDTVKAMKWAKDKVKALVEKNKNGDMGRVRGLSLATDAIKEVGGELGKDSSAVEE